jgi:hypothetical protein
MPEHSGHKVRVANSVAMIQRRLQDVESAERVDVMELVGIWDELNRIDRKWRDQIAAGQLDRRSTDDEPKLQGYFDRLIRQIERKLREGHVDHTEETALRTALEKCRSREPLPSMP